APARSGIREQYGLRPIINVCGTMTALGASIVVPEAVSAVAGLLPEFVEIDDLQRKASPVIARLCGTEAGFVTASAAAGITLAVAGAITERTAAALYVVSHHTVQYGLLPLDELAALCHARGVPVIVDAASEY